MKDESFTALAVHALRRHKWVIDGYGPLADVDWYQT